MLMLLTACSSSDTTEEPQPTMLTIYVYSPENPVITRGDVGNVDATAGESQVTQLQIWIYENTNGNTVGYLSTNETATLNGGEGAVYQIPVPDDFAQNKPNVDVYVLANVKTENCGITSLPDENTSRADLLANVKIIEAKFGLSSLVTSVPGDGLPMAGKLLDQHVVGDAPVLRVVGTTSNIATVPLTRAVSKLRFVFANTTGDQTLSITGISLNYNSTTAYTAYLLSSPLASVAQKDNPAIYVYNGQTAQDYETLLNEAGLTQTTPYYLRESDKKIEGTITYEVDNVDQTPATFRMSEPGDFLRNHSWIVYAYYEGLSGMQISVVDVTPWEDRNGSHTIYNW